MTATPTTTRPSLRERWHDLRHATMGEPWLPLGLLFGLNTVDELDRAAFSLLAPEIRDDFGLDLQGILTLTAFVAFLALGSQFLIGYVADRYHRVRMALTGAAIWSVFSFLTALAPTVGALGAARVGSSVGKAVNEPTHRSLLADYYPPKSRVGVFGVYQMADPVGRIVGPIIAGLVGKAFGWRIPFLLFAIPTGLLVISGMRRLKEPPRGQFERLELGANLDVDEEPASFGEAWRTIRNIRSLRLVCYAIPFLAVSLVGFAVFDNLLYDEVFGLDEAQRGLLAAVNEPFAILGLIIGVPIATRMAATDPSQIARLTTVAACIVMVAVLGFAASPWLPLVLVFRCIISAANAIVLPGLLALGSLVIPPRMRAMGNGIVALWVAPGLIVLPILGNIADQVGIRIGIAMVVPVYAVGAMLLVRSGAHVRADMDRVRQSLLGQAATRDGSAVDAQLVVSNVDVAYGQTQVLFGVDLTIQRGEILALLGTNGAGKSTLLSAVCGLVTPKRGSVTFEGADITGQAANVTAASGIVLMPGGKGVFPTLTVAENLQLAGWLFDDDQAYLAEAREQVLEYFPILRKRWNEKAGNMSGGEQQMLTLGQVFIAKPKLLLIDELSLGLAPVVVEQLLGIVRAIHERGTTVVLVEQSVNVACTLADRAVFMEKGEIRFDGPTAELLERPDILRAVFLQGAAAGGDSFAAAQPGRPKVAVRDRKRPFTPHCDACGTTHDLVMETVGLSVAFGGVKAVNGVSMQLRAGEILGLIGPNGAGKTTIFDLISGYLVPTAGRVVLGGVDVTALSPDARAMRGLGRSFQDARLFPALTVADTLAVAFERHLKVKDPVAAALGSAATRAAEADVKGRVEALVELMNLQAFANKFISELSTGTRRVVDLACSLAHDPTVLLLDEPSSGIAQRETEALGPVLLDIRDQTGAALIVVEHDMPLITTISDRIMALELGTEILTGRPDDVLVDPRVVESYLGGSEEVIFRSGTTPTRAVAETPAARPPRQSPRAANVVSGTTRRRLEPLVATRKDRT